MAGKNQVNKMMQQVQKMQADMLAAQDALAAESVEGSAGGGVVKAIMTGAGALESVTIDPGVVDPEDVEMLQDLVVAAVSEAMRKTSDLQAQRMGAVTGGLDLGGLNGLL